MNDVNTCNMDVENSYRIMD